MVRAVANMLSGDINPVLVGLLLLEPVLPRRNGAGDAVERWPLFWLRAAIAIGVATVLAEVGKKVVIWPGHPWFPSGHMTFATAAATCLVWRRRGAWWVVALAATLLVLIGVSLVVAGWHSPEDVAGGFLLGATVACAVFRLRRR